MRAIVLREFGGPEVLRAEELPDPQAGPGEAIVRVRAAALNHRDAWIRKNQYAKVELPAVLGSDGAGLVVAVGPDADPAWMGREVILNPSLNWGDSPAAQGPGFRILGMPDYGTYAELVRIPAANLAAKPAHLSFEEAAALPLAGLTAWRAVVSRARVQAGETVLVTGAGGGVSTFAIAIAASLGAKVWVTSGSDEKIDRARQLGAQGGVNYRSEDWPKQLTKLSGPVHAAIDSTGGSNFGQLLDTLAPGGRIANYGATTGPVPELALAKVFWKQLSLLGTTMGSPAEFADFVRWCDQTRFRPAVDQTFPLAAAPAAHRRMDEAGQFGKIILRP